MNGQGVTSFFGHPIEYWIELNARAKELNAEDLLAEVVILRAQVKDHENFIKRLMEFINRKG